MASFSPSLIGPANSYSSFKTQLKCPFLQNALPVPPVAGAQTLRISMYHTLLQLFYDMLILPLDENLSRAGNLSGSSLNP